MVLILKCCQGFPDIAEYYSNYVDLDWVLNDASNNLTIILVIFMFFFLAFKIFFVNVNLMYIQKNVLFT